MKKHLLAALVLMSSTTAFCAGYQLNMQGIRQMAMGGTGAAWAWDASTIFYNPGGLARLRSIQAYAGVSFVMPSTAFGNTMGSANTRPNTLTPFNIYIGGPVQQDSRFALGLGIYSTAGANVRWDDNWIGRYMSQSMKLRTVMFQPTLSYRVGEFLSVGAGFVFGTGNVDMRQAMSFHGQNGPSEPGNDDATMHLNGNANGVGFNIGIQLKPSDRFQIGLTYRSQVNMSVGGGSATFVVPASLVKEYPKTRFDTHIPIPQVATIGIGFRPAKHLTLQFDLSYTGWNSYDSLNINFKDQTNSLQNMHSPRHYRNTLTPRIGANYRISRVVSVMLGGYYDPTPVTSNYVSPDMPDANHVAVTCGISIRPMPRFTIMAAFEGTSTAKRNANYDFGGFSGVYKSGSATPALAVYYNF